MGFYSSLGYIYLPAVDRRKCISYGFFCSSTKNLLPKPGYSNTVTYFLKRVAMLNRER